MPLVIIESSSKVKKFSDYTGFKVIATGGHFRNIPVKSMNINLETYEPVFAIIPGKEKGVVNIKKMAKGQTVFLATDPSREGEAVACFVEEDALLKAKPFGV